MSKIIYHMGTGTYFDMDDGVYIIDTNTIAGGHLIDGELMDKEGDDIAINLGQTFDQSFIAANEGISFSKAAIISEAHAFIDTYGDDLEKDTTAMRWVCDGATAEDIDAIQTAIFFDDDLWVAFTRAVRDAIREVWADKQDRGN